MAKAAKPAAKKAAEKKTMTKSQFIAKLAEAMAETTVTKKDVTKILDVILETIKSELSPKGPGKFVYPGLARITLTRKEAVKGGIEKINRLNGKPYVTQDKPAHNVVKIRPIKAIKEALK